MLEAFLPFVVGFVAGVLFWALAGEGWARR